MLYTLTLKNLTIRFTNTEVRPKISSCKQNNDTIELVMKSEAADGNVVVTAVPGIYPTKIFYVKSAEQTFSYPIDKNMTSKSRNADFSATCNLEVSFSLSHSYNITWANYSGLPSNFLGLLSGADNPVNETVSQIVFWITVVVVIIVGIVIFVVVVVVGFFAFPYIYPLFSCCCSCIKRGAKNIEKSVETTEVKKEKEE